MSDELDPIPSDVPPADTPPAPPKRKRNRSTGRPPGRPRKDPADKAPGTTTGPGRPTKMAQREKHYTASLARVGAIIYAFNATDGLIFLEGVPRTAKALAAVSEQNPTIGKVLDAMVKSGAWLELGAALGVVAVPIAVNHGKLPPIAAAFVTGDLETIASAMTPVAPPPAPAPAPEPVAEPVDGASPENGAGLVDGFQVPAA
ncbi:MAG: hypothetical protein AB7H92_18650 [Microbacteriaceae bacterium]